LKLRIAEIARTERESDLFQVINIRLRVSRFLIAVGVK